MNGLDPYLKAEVTMLIPKKHTAEILEILSFKTNRRMKTKHTILCPHRIMLQFYTHQSNRIRFPFSFFHSINFPISFLVTEQKTFI